MNTTKIGNDFENRVYAILKDLLDDDDFFVPGKKSKIFRKKAYYSSKREANIIFDLTIETALSPTVPYSILTIIECKKYNHSVTVDDIEEFESKIRQIGEHNTKGVLFTNANLQSAALSLAKSLKIGIVKLQSDDKYEWINYRLDKSVLRLSLEKTEEYFTVSNNANAKFIGLNNGKLLDNLPDYLIATGVIDMYVHKEKFMTIPYVTDERIKNIVSRLYTHDISDGLKLDTTKLCNFLSTCYPVDFEFEQPLSNGVLGKIHFDPLKITVSSTLLSDLQRWRFTLSHEIGHLILHYKLLQPSIIEKIDDENSLGFQENKDSYSVKRLEFQSNIFAANLLLPEERLFIVVKKFFSSNRINKGHVYVDHQAVNQQLLKHLLNTVSEAFDVSMAMAKIRLIKLGLVKDNYDFSIQKVLRENRYR